MGEPVVEQGRCGAVEWAVCARPYPGQERSGDTFVVRPAAAGTLVAVVDGLGHGDEAADAADLARDSLATTAAASATDALATCHQALRGSRGAAVTLALVDADEGHVDWVAVGNVEAAVVSRARAGRPPLRSSVPLRGGVVGSRLPPLRVSGVSLAPGDVLVSATDGLAVAFLDSVDPSLPARVLAERLHRRYAKTTDDALVLVATVRDAG